MIVLPFEAIDWLKEDYRGSKKELWEIGLKEGAPLSAREDLEEFRLAMERIDAENKEREARGMPCLEY